MTRKAVGLAVLASLALPAAAEAKIAVGQSIHGVRLGMTRQQVRVHLGRGTTTRDNPSIYTYRHDTYQVIFANGRVSSVETFSRRERTSLGLGVGTTLAKLGRRQEGLHCLRGHNGDIDCYVGSNTRGHVYTDFYLGNGKSVTGVLVGAGYL